MLSQLVAQVRKSEGDDYYDRVAKWFLDDPERRAVDPF